MKPKRQINKAISGRIIPKGATDFSPKKPNVQRAQKFEGQNIDNNTAKLGIESEDKQVNKTSNIITWVIIGGFLLTIWDIRDKGLLFEGLGIKFAGSLVGILVIVIALIILSINKTNIKINNVK